MKYQQFYRKYKTSYPPLISPWIFVLIIAVAALIVPLFVYRTIRTINFSISDYLKQIEYFMFFGLPIGLFLFWTNWREAVKRRKRYCWVGKFEVIGKSSSFLFYYLNLFPGEENKVKVDRILFHKTHVGDYIVIRRDAFGSIDEIRRVKDVWNRLTKVHS